MLYPSIVEEVVYCTEDTPQFLFKTSKNHTLQDDYRNNEGLQLLSRQLTSNNYQILLSTITAFIAAIEGSMYFLDLVNIL
jgi:hypothetical protein